MKKSVTMQVPAEATLWVHFSDGTQREAKESDLHQFGASDYDKTYDRVMRNLNRAMPEGRHFRDDFSILGYAIERSIIHPGNSNLCDFTCSDDDETIKTLREYLAKMPLDDAR